MKKEKECGEVRIGVEILHVDFNKREKVDSENYNECEWKEKGEIGGHRGEVRSCDEKIEYSERQEGDCFIFAKRDKVEVGSMLAK